MFKTVLDPTDGFDVCSSSVDWSIAVLSIHRTLVMTTQVTDPVFRNEPPLLKKNRLSDNVPL